MKIAMIGTTLFHQGAEYVLAALARGMAARGCEMMKRIFISSVQKEFETERAAIKWMVELEVMT